MRTSPARPFNSLGIALLYPLPARNSLTRAAVSRCAFALGFRAMTKTMAAQVAGDVALVALALASHRIFHSTQFLAL